MIDLFPVYYIHSNRSKQAQICYQSAIQSMVLPQKVPYHTCICTTMTTFYTLPFLCVSLIPTISIVSKDTQQTIQLIYLHSNPYLIKRKKCYIDPLKDRTHYIQSNVSNEETIFLSIFEANASEFLKKSKCLFGIGSRH